jgi:prepilin-type processing-associated H-X9-DG protein
MPEIRKRLTHWLSWIGLAILIVLVVLMLLPAQSRDPAGRRAVCLNNVKTLALALAMYADQYDGRLPMDSVTPTLVGSMKLLSNVVATAKFLHCPNDPRPGARAEADFSKLTIENISYSYVPNLTWQDQPDSIVALDRIQDRTAGSSWPTNSSHMGRGGNILFNDGHVQWCTNLPSALKDKDGKQIVLSP